MPLRRLAALERKKIDFDELPGTAQADQGMEDLLQSPRKVLNVISKNGRIEEPYATPRRTLIVDRPAGRSAGHAGDWCR